MESKRAWFLRVWVAGIAFALATVAMAADALFPRPLHIVRRVEDPVAGTTATLHEYCAGDQIVTVHGSRVVIADYAGQQLLEIDRDAGTYSITRFDEIAKSNVALRAQSHTAWKATPLGVKAAHAGRSLDSFQLAREGMTLEVGVDRGTRVSRAALEVLIGAAYPNQRRDEHEAILQAAGVSRDRQIAANSIETKTDYPLPFEQTLTIESEGERLTMRNTILEVRGELAPEETKLIPPGSRQVESRAARLARELRDLDRIP